MIGKRIWDNKIDSASANLESFVKQLGLVAAAVGTVVDTGATAEFSLNLNEPTVGATQIQSH